MNNIKTQIVYSLFCVLDYIFSSFVLAHQVYKGNYDMIEILIKVWTKRSWLTLRLKYISTKFNAIVPQSSLLIYSISIFF